MRKVKSKGGPRGRRKSQSAQGWKFREDSAPERKLPSTIQSRYCRQTCPLDQPAEGFGVSRQEGSRLRNNWQ